MAYSSIPPSRQRDRLLLASTVTLALWRLRRTWGLLTVTGVGMVAAVLLVCAVPLYSQVAMAVGLHSALAAAPQDMDISVSAIAPVSQQYVTKVSRETDADFSRELGPYLASSRFSVQSDVYFISHTVASKSGKGGKGSKGSSVVETNDQLRFIGVAMTQAASHVRLVSGRLPREVSSGVEIALATENAAKLHVGLGSVITVDVPFAEVPVAYVVVHLPLRVVGLFDGGAAQSEPYWQQVGFLSTPRGSSPPGTIYTGLVSSNALLDEISIIANGSALQGLSPVEPFSYNWYYHLDSNKVTLDNLNAVIAGMNGVQVDLANNSDLNTPVTTSVAQTQLSPDALVQYRDRLSVAQIPVMSLLVLVMGLVLFFVSMMADLLVERQADSIAILRSRGASPRQVLGAMLTQSLGLGLIAFIAGPLLAFGCVYLISQNMFSAIDPGALRDALNNPWLAIEGLVWYALAAVVVAIIAMMIAMFRTASRDVLAMRRESSRTTSRPLWQRLNLDVVAAILMLVGYGISFYLTASGVLDPQLRFLLLAPLTLLRSVFLLLACMLLFLRLFPFLLQGGSWLAARSRRATPLVALAQMARAPHQSVRMTLLLALSTAFAIFTLVFTASQAQHAFDVSNYESGADFSGALVQQVKTSQFDDIAARQLAAATARYRHIAGVLTASLGYTAQAAAGANEVGLSAQLDAVDADTFAQTENWTTQDSTQSLSSIMALLVLDRLSGMQANFVPAIVDEATMHALDLSLNDPLTMSVSNGEINFKVVGEVQHIPGVIDSTQSGDTNAVGGVLVDYKTYASVYANTFRNVDPAHVSTIPINHAWLHTKSDAASLANVRKMLSNGPLQLSPLYDRQDTMSALNNDPLYLALIVVLALGATTALLLALIGNLIASWLSARSRLINFAVLRALGTPPHSIAEVLTWEQSIIYTTAILLGVLFGAVLSALVVPVLVFTSVASGSTISDLGSGALYLVQSVPPIRVIVPSSLIIALAVLVGICVIALGMMIRIVSRPSIGQTLRLSQD